MMLSVQRLSRRQIPRVASFVRGACLAATLLTVTAAPIRGQSAPSDQAQAQSVDSARSDSSPPWITKRELVGAGLSVIGTLVVAPLDKPVANELQDPGWQKDEPVHSASQALAFAGGEGPFLLGGGLFAVGKLAGSSVLTGAGEHLTEAVVLAAAVTGVGKGIAGRALPGVQTSEQFQWGRGFHKGNGPFVSFPSGHTAAAFAAAAALTEESQQWRPGLARYVGPAAYLSASAIGFARLYQHVHWVSDLPLAAAIGIWSGLTVESHVHRDVHRSRHGNRIAPVLASTTIQRSADGRTLVGWSIPFVVPN